MSSSFSPKNALNLPYLGFGLGLRFAHYDYVLQHKPNVDWFEIISEDFMDAHEGHWKFLSDIGKTYPIVMHGVSLSVGSPDPLNMHYLQRLKRLANHVNPPWISDHVCWTGVHGINTHDLMPVPYTEDALQHFIDRIHAIQDILGRPLVLENPSTYLQFSASTMPEWEFIARMAEKSGCGLLLDINNVYVSAFNHRFDPLTYLHAMPKDRIVQIHLAGHRNLGTHIIDTHDAPVIDDVWQLYTAAIRLFGPTSTMIEWDDNIPEFPILLAELQRAKNSAGLNYV